MSKQNINFGEGGRKDVLNGMRLLSKSVKSTLGPGGRNALINTGNGTIITKDGVTVAKNVKPDHPLESIGADIIRQASERTAHTAGDGTTTSTIIAEAIVEEGITKLASGVNAISLQRGIMSAAKTISNHIKENIAETCDDEKIRQVAMVSTNWDDELSSLISTAIIKAGPDGAVNVNNVPHTESSIVTTDGLQIERGYLSPHFVTNKEKNQCILENPLVFLSGIKITNNVQIKAILEAAYNAGKGQKPLLIIAPEIEPQIITVMVVNVLNGVMNLGAIKCPGFGDRMKDQMGDLQAVMGGTYFTDELARDFTTIKESDFASCERVIITRDNTTFIGCKGNPIDLENRINFLKSQVENATESWQVRLCKERIAKLSNGVVVLNIGASTDIEAREKMDRADDAICATRAAIAEGIVPGGGITLAKLSKKKLEYETGDEGFKLGIEIVKKAIKQPLKQLLMNSGVEDADLIISSIINKPIEIGYDVNSGKLVNMIEKGIIDPSKVTRQALENAASVAGIILTTECVISQGEE